MKGIAQIFRDLDRVIDGEADELNEPTRIYFRTKLSAALNRLNNPPAKAPDNIIRLHRPDPLVGNTPSRSQFK